MSKVIYLVGEAAITCPMPEKPHLKWSDEAESAELVRKGLEEAKGSWPEKCLQRAFVEGAKWWEFKRTGATMWQDDQGKAEQAAIDKYGIDPVVLIQAVGTAGCELSSDRKGDLRQVVEDNSELMTRLAPNDIGIPSDGFDISTFNLKNFEDCMLLMGGEWLKGARAGGVFFAYCREFSWDNHNQPTRWKPL